MSAGVCSNTCLAYGDVQQVSPCRHHQRSTSSALRGTNPQPERGGVGAAPSHHPRQLRWSSSVCVCRAGCLPRVHEGPIPATGCILPLGMVVAPLLLSFRDEGPNGGSPRISKPRTGLEDGPRAKRSSAGGGVDPNCDCNVHAEQNCEAVLGSSAGHLEETGNLGTMILGRHFIGEARPAFLHVLHICVYAFIIFLLIRTTRQEELVDRRCQSYSDYSSNTESTCCYVNTHLVLYFLNGSIVYPS